MEKNRVIEVKGVTKKLDGHLVINRVSCDIYQGESFGILGPRHSGKSTLIQLMYGTLRVEVGDLYVLGLNAKTNPREMKSRIGIVPQDETLDLDFTVMENLLMFSSYLGLESIVAMRRIEDLLKLLLLEAVANHPVRQLDVNYRRRLAIARGLLNQPELLFFDEPTLGLNQTERLSIWKFLDQIRSEDHTMVFTTHFAEEAERICDRVALVDHGKILIIGEPRKLIEETVGHHLAEITLNREDLQYYINRLSEQKFEYQTFRDQLKVYLKRRDDTPRALTIFKDLHVDLRMATLGDVFLKLSGHALREDPL